MSERRYSPLATLFAATFLFRIGNAVAALALPWFVLSHTKSAAWAGATAASSVIATIIGAWVGGGLVDRFGRAPVALISGVVGGVAMASIPLLDAVGALSNTGLIACVVLGAAFDAPGMAAQDSELGYRKYKPPFCSSSEVSYLKFPHSFTAQAPILTAGPA